MPDFIQNIDEAIQITIQTGWHIAFLDKILSFFSVICNHGEIWIAAALIMLCFKKTRKPALIIGAVLIFEFLTNDFIIKNLFERPRPYNVLTQFEPVLPRLNSFSFPSGHSASSGAAAVTIAWTEGLYVQWNKANNWFSKHRLGITAIVIALVIIFSRVYLFMHWPSDVIGGAIYGTLCSMIGLCVMKIVDARTKVTR